MGSNVGAAGTPPQIPWYTHPRFNILKRHIGSPPGSPPPIGTRPEPSRSYINAAYYPSWRVYKNEPPSCMKLNMISHVFYAFARLKTDGTVTLLDEYADCKKKVDGANGCLQAFREHKTQYPHLKVILSIGGGNEECSGPFAQMAANPTSRNTFGLSAREMVLAHGLDGIDIDWEHPSDSCQGNDYVSMLTVLREYLPRPFLLTTALPTGEWCLKHINLKAAQEYLDFINLMAYDFSGHWVGVSGHQSQLYTPSEPHNASAANSGDKAVNYMVSKGVPKHKIILGIPAYGRSFLGCTDIGQKFSETGGIDGTFNYKDLPRPGATEHYDITIGAAYSIGGDGGFVTYDNHHSVIQKAAYVKQNGLGGVFYWTGTADCHNDPERSLIEASFRAFNTR